MNGITIRQRGNFNKCQRFFNRLLKKEYLNILDNYGKIGVQKLAAATPKDTGLTADSWTYEISHNLNQTKIEWFNTNDKMGLNIAILLEYGHGTKNGGYVAGRRFINPAIQPVFDKMAKEVWREVNKI